MQGSQVLETAQATKGTLAQSAWSRFVDRVERGEIVDLAGQYVAKGTVVADHRLSRPSFDAATPAFAQHYRLSKGGEVVALAAPGKGITTNLIDPICNDCGPLGPPIPVFVSSEGVAPYSGADNPQGYIYDLKVVSTPVAHAGYTIVPADLNRGAGGGKTIYLTFTRDPSMVLYGQEKGLANSIGPVTYIDVKTIDPFIWIAPPKPPQFSYPIWNSGGVNQQYGLTELDLNAGTGGDYIYSYQQKQPYPQIPIEVGVVYGQSSSIQPPSGWDRNGVNLNKGAGGDYIYFCSKHR